MNGGRVRVQYFVVTRGHKGCYVYGSVAEGGGRGAVYVLRLEGTACSMLTMMLGGDLDVATRV